MAPRKHRHGSDERARRDLFDEVGEDDHERALGAGDRRERQLVVGVDGRRLQVEDRPYERVAPAPARGQPAVDGGVEGDRAAAVAELVGDEPDRGRGVDRDVQPRGAAAQRRRHEPAAVEHADDVAVLLDAVLVAHRPPHPHGRRPVDLADVVVREVVADRLELGAEAERTARALARLAEAARAHGERKPAGRRQVGVDEQLLRLARGVVPGRQAERAAHAQRRRWQHEAPATAHDELCLQSAVALLRGELDLRRRARLAHADAAQLVAAARSPASRARRAPRSKARDAARAAGAARRWRRR